MDKIVENNIVKMEWLKSGWLQTLGRGKKESDFIFASKDYPSATKGSVTVFFTPESAFIWASDAHTADEDLWNATELKDWCKENLDGAFPVQYDEYVAIIPSGENGAVDSLLEEYGITEHKADIEARMQDIRPYGEEIYIM